MTDNITNQELLQAINKGFSAIEEKMATKEDLTETEKRLGSKIDGLSNRLDGEVVRQADQHANHEKRIAKLEDEVGVS